MEVIKLRLRFMPVPNRTLMRAGYISEMFPRRAIGVGGRPLATLRPAKGYNEVGGVAEEEDLDGVEYGAGDGAKKSWAASNKSEQDYEFPGDPLACQWACDAKALGHIV